LTINRAAARKHTMVGKRKLRGGQKYTKLNNNSENFRGAILLLEGARPPSLASGLTINSRPGPQFNLVDTICLKSSGVRHFLSLWT